MRLIRKKILSEYFEPVKAGKKNYELRKDDDGISVGDILMLCEWDGCRFTGRIVFRLVSYVFRDAGYGLLSGYVLISWC